MAQRVEILLIDDIDNGAADETVTFAVDGANYEIDLSNANAANLREALRPYVEAGRRISSGSGSGRRAAPRQASKGKDVKEIRAWAKANGYEVNDRGRVPDSLRDAYAQAHQGQ